MGRGKQWASTECKHLAEAWIAVSEDQDELEVKGANQDSDRFWNRVYSKYIAKGRQEGCYGERTLSAVKNFWSDNISRDCRKFNKSLVKVYASRPTGVTQAQMTNIAVALHQKKADTASSRHRDFPLGDWKFYEAWLVLKEHRAYMPPTPEQLELSIELEEDEDDEEEQATNEDNSSLTSSSNNEARQLFTPGTSVAGGSTKKRGPGPGAKKSRKLAQEAEYRKKKVKMQESMLELASERQKQFAQYVTNTAKAQAFNMAMNGYNAFKDSDPARAEQYKQQLDYIMFGSSNGDGDSSS